MGERLKVSQESKRGEKCNYSSGSQQFCERRMYTVLTVPHKNSTKRITNHHREPYYCSARARSSGRLRDLSYRCKHYVPFSELCILTPATMIITSYFLKWWQKCYHALSWAEAGCWARRLRSAEVKDRVSFLTADGRLIVCSRRRQHTVGSPSCFSFIICS